jgi:hypothetical protein
MSASDAAPLPRLGEVFFDVRGDSRSMRLSWYADTDVAVFSIWQGGKCTGTFRLPMDDLSRMIEILRRGPEGRFGRRAAERRPPERASDERRPGDHGARDPGLSARGYDSDRTVVHNDGGRSREFEGHGPDEYGSDVYDASDYESAGYRSDDYRPAEYDGRRSARQRPERYEPADYGQHDQDSEWWPASDSNEAERTGQRFVPADNVGYGEQRFAPPYVRPRPDASEPGFMDDPEYRLPADPAGRSRHSAGRHSGGQGQ